LGSRGQVREEQKEERGKLEGEKEGRTEGGGGKEGKRKGGDREGLTPGWLVSRILALGGYRVRRILFFLLFILLAVIFFRLPLLSLPGFFLFRSFFEAEGETEMFFNFGVDLPRGEYGGYLGDNRLEQLVAHCI
jgi:hypothetical protein